MLSFLCTSQFLAEVAKLTAQLGGALLIAWLTVRWALKRYKTEKLWDRETEALVTVLAAIGDLEAVNGRWIQDEVSQAGTTEANDAALRQRYWSAKARLEGVAATATVLLPQEMATIIDTLLKALNKQYRDWQEDLFETDSAVATARQELVRLGRQRLKG